MKPTIKEADSQPLPVSEDLLTDQFDVYRYLTDVRSRIKKDISTDFVLAKLEDQDKTGVIEMTVNAYLAKAVAESLKPYCRSVEEMKEVEHEGNRIFDMYMTKIYMVVLLNRNKEQNPMVRWIVSNLGKGGQEEEQRVTPEEAKGFINRVKDKLGPKK